MSNVAVVTDSTANLPDDLVRSHQISVVPQVLIWGDKTYRDGVDIQPDEFYQRLQKASVTPSTSQATIGSFQQVFEKLHSEGKEILAVLLAAKLSGTMDSAIQARRELPNACIELVDSNTAAMALGFVALEAARLAQNGASIEECKQAAEQASKHVGVFFAVDTLEFLHRGGRIGGGTRFLGTALNIKPILELKDGHVEAVERVRTRKKSLNRLIELVEERVQGKSPFRLAVLHANAAGEAHELLEQAQARLNADEKVLSTVSPVVGTHTGPGTVGLAFMAGM
jgi:DegV family protein with EDD domain